MNADDVMKYGHMTLMSTLNAVDENLLEVEGVCGVWSVKNILAHLTSFELLLADALSQLNGETSTPTLDARLAQGGDFNDLQVDERKHLTYAEQLAEYQTAHEKAAALLADIPAEKRRENGLFPWYGEDYDLEDMMLYTVYAHKREHCGQIGIFRG